MCETNDHLFSRDLVGQKGLASDLIMAAGNRKDKLPPKVWIFDFDLENSFSCTHVYISYTTNKTPSLLQVISGGYYTKIALGNN